MNACKTMLWLLFLTLLLEAFHCNAKCKIVGFSRDNGGDIDYNKTQAMCSTSEDKQWMVADQVSSDPDEIDYCESSELQPLCPSKCDYVVRPLHPKFLFACVVPDIVGECASHNVKTPWPNGKTKTCTACSVKNCETCHTGETCTACFEGFFMSEGASECVFNLDKRLKLLRVLPTILAVLLFIIFVHLVLRCFVFEGPAAANDNLKAIRQGRKHRHFCKVQDWEVAHSQEKRRYGLCANLHKQNLCGVGLNLYFNNLLFQLYVAFLCFAVTYALDRGSGLTEFLERFEGSFSKHYNDELSEICYQHVLWYGFLYVVLFVSSLFFIKSQVQFRNWFDAVSTDMEDYMILIKGFPKMVGAEIKEDVIKKDLERAFQRLVPDVKLHGVSIAYDFFDQREEVEGVLANLVQQDDIDAGIYDEELTHESDTGACFVNHKERDAQTVREWFTTRPLSTTDTVFAVFDYKTHQKQVSDKVLEQGGEFEVQLTGHQEPVKLQVKEDVMDPPTVFWWAMGLEKRRILKRCFKTCVKILIAILLVAGLIFFPIGHFLIAPFANTGEPPSAGLMLIAGIVMGIIYGQFFMNTQNLSAEIGFHRKDTMDACIFCIFFVVVFLNALFQMGVTISSAVPWPAGMALSEMFGVASVRGILQQPLLVNGVYSFMMPGLFFMPKVIEPLAAGLVPYCLNQLFAHIVYVWGCFPGPLGIFFKAVLPFAPDSKTNYHPRNAEKALDPMEIPLPFMYVDNLLINCICFSMLFFISDQTHTFFSTMVVWTLWLYCFSRWAFLRFNKRAFFKTNTLDKTWSYAWGIPLSLLACSWSSWCMRFMGGGINSPFFLLLPFFVSMALWLFCCHQTLLHPNPIDFGEQDVNTPYHEAKLHTFYSWFNVNPIYVLKSNYCPDLIGDHANVGSRTPRGKPSLKFFQVGKEYLLIPQADARKEAIDRAKKVTLSEIEWYLDRLMWCLERCCCRRKVCCVIHRHPNQRATDNSMEVRAMSVARSVRPGRT